MRTAMHVRGARAHDCGQARVIRSQFGQDVTSRYAHKRIHTRPEQPEKLPAKHTNAVNEHLTLSEC